MDLSQIASSSTAEEGKRKETEKSPDGTLVHLQQADKIPFDSMKEHLEHLFATSKELSQSTELFFKHWSGSPRPHGLDDFLERIFGALPQGRYEWSGAFRKIAFNCKEWAESNPLTAFEVIGPEDVDQEGPPLVMNLPEGKTVYLDRVIMEDPHLDVEPEKTFEMRVTNNGLSLGDAGYGVEYRPDGEKDGQPLPGEAIRVNKDGVERAVITRKHGQEDEYGAPVEVQPEKPRTKRVAYGPSLDEVTLNSKFVERSMDQDKGPQLQADHEKSHPAARGRNVRTMPKGYQPEASPLPSLWSRIQFADLADDETEGGDSQDQADIQEDQQHTKDDQPRSRSSSRSQDDVQEVETSLMIGSPEPDFEEESELLDAPMAVPPFAPLLRDQVLENGAPAQPEPVSPNTSIPQPAREQDGNGPELKEDSQPSLRPQRGHSVASVEPVEAEFKPETRPRRPRSIEPSTKLEEAQEVPTEPVARPSRNKASAKRAKTRVVRKKPKEVKTKATLPEEVKVESSSQNEAGVDAEEIAVPKKRGRKRAREEEVGKLPVDEPPKRRLRSHTKKEQSGA
ncbi:hypothetical protein BDN72DRAFT_957758 [Pluteus cervinus]|uniref:Uncharacterized protein n=1 Tax=Pluteus cervinus TaxID=181527 RepID=A0ACD3B1P8_9AGAR|nr:hypothetical protein BDN72DRAFT_957758 [Pluteus cervinus]